MWIVNLTMLKTDALSSFDCNTVPSNTERQLGCFYGGGMHGCQGEGDPIAFAPFVGRRKRLESRKYTDKHNRPWQMAL